jgi:1,4-alpha-glucan branching enzyme
MSDGQHSLPAAATKLDPAIHAIVAARHHDPFEVLGRHTDADGETLTIRAHLPGASQASIVEGEHSMLRIPGTDVFEWQGPVAEVPEHYRLRWRDPSGHEHVAHDPYCFGPQLSDFDMHLFNEGRHWHIYRILGAHHCKIDDIPGVLFATWAPNAERVSVVGDFNGWDGRAHPMRVRGGTGIWELFIPELNAGSLYKFEIRNRDTGAILLKSDPYGQRCEVRPNTASVVASDVNHDWSDQEWMQARAHADWLHGPVSIYEVHLGSWQRDENGNFLDYRELARRLVEYVTDLGFTHIELLPVSEHPLDASWGYQTAGYFAVTSRHGTPEDFRFFVDYCHQHGVGVILDWVPGHFPKDMHGLARFDGTALYEHDDPRLGEHREWGTLIFNYGRSEVKNFLLSNALYWLEEYHVDGLRVDAVASMLYLDYSREPGEWLPNRYGGNENLEAIDFLRELNTVVHERCPGTLMIAEESTSWPMVSRPVYLGGLGFTMKWNMGWMNDTLEYFNQDPVYRRYHHDRLTFSMLYAFTENFILPFSHDEVVHGKASLIYKMPGDDWQRLANLRLLYAYQFTHPGKKLLFMGGEFAQGPEWRHDQALDWYVLDYPKHRGIQSLVRDLNRLYRDNGALYRNEFDWTGFEWVDCHDADQSVLTFLRKDGDDFLVVALNFTPVPRHGYRIGVPRAGAYREHLNTDSELYGGSNIGNLGLVLSEPTPWMGHPQSISITLPPLAAVVLAPTDAA